MKSQSQTSQPRLFQSLKGFTLIEAIATLVLSGVLIAALLPVIGSSLQGSRRALARMPATHSLRSEMDAIRHMHRSMNPSDLPALSAAIAAAASATSPAPPYILLENDWVAFDDQGVEFIPSSGEETALRVTLSNSSGERLTAYFF